MLKTINQEFFLSDKHDNLAEDISFDNDLWSKKIKIDNHYEGRCQSFSTMLSNVRFFIYDHPDILREYPDGFFSENMALIPYDMYQRMQLIEPLALIKESTHHYWNLSGLIFVTYLTQMVEKKYNINFSKEETEYIISHSLSNTYKYENNVKKIPFLQNRDNDNLEIYKHNENIINFDINLISNYMNEIFNKKKPTFVSNKSISVMCKELDLNAHLLFDRLSSDNFFIDYSLLKNTEILDKKHPFNKLINKIYFPYKSIDLLDLTTEQASKKFLDLDFHQKYIIFNSFEQLSHEIKINSKNDTQLINNIKGIWSNLALQNSDSTFDYLLSILMENCIKPYIESKSLLEQEKLNYEYLIKIKLSHAINDNYFCNESKRKVLIDRVSGISDDYSIFRNVSFKNSKKLKHN